MPKRYSKRPPRHSDHELTRQARELYDNDDDELDDLLETPPPSKRQAKKKPTPENEGDRDEPPATGTGLVIALESGLCDVEYEGEVVECVLPSRIAHDQRATIAVGDRVRFAPHEADTHRVVRVLPRHSELSRPDPHNPHERRLIAANVDVVVHVGSVVSPVLRPTLIDRFAIVAAQGGSELLVWINKADLLDDEGRQELERTLAPYRALDVPILLGSTKTGEGIDVLRDRLAGQTAVFAGHSGVGKSSLLTALAPEVDVEVGAVSDAWGKGRHTTTSSSLYRIGDDTRVIDTPGVRELGLDIDPEALDEYFPAIAEHAESCRFRNCRHDDEPGCAVRKALEVGALPAARYAAYRRIRSSLEDEP